MKHDNAPRDHCVELLQQYFFSRTDKVAFRNGSGKPNPALAGELLPVLLAGHVRGKELLKATIESIHSREPRKLQATFALVPTHRMPTD